MGSSKARNQRNDLRRNYGTHARRVKAPRLEFLEDRTMLAAGVVTNTITQPPTQWKPTDNNLADWQNGPMANEGQDLVNIYQEYQQYTTNPGGGAFQSKYADLIEFQGNSVGVDVNTWGNFTTAETSLVNLGMQVFGSDPKYGIISGWMPINELPTLARMPQVISAAPLFKPVARYTGYQGIAYNEALTTLQADTASNQYNVDGTGVTVGIVSTSINQYGGGLASSYKTGDLNPNNPVNVLYDDPSDPTDEGRAMAENIHDVAPGASLAFSAAGLSDTVMAQSITNLATEANAQIIVDDIGFADDPYFQPGVISQAIQQVVTQNNVSYFSAAGNTSLAQGYLSAFRGVSASVTGVGSGTFMNFNPNGGTTTLLPITISGTSQTNPASFDFQFDQPWYTSNGVTSQMNMYILNSSGTVVASGTNDNTATQQPWQYFGEVGDGNYFVAIQLVKGPAPNFVEFQNFNENVNAVVSQQFGNAGTTYYPTTSGHASSPYTIGVGAMPWWGAAPWPSNATQINSEPFSSQGPVINDLTASGQPTAPQLILAPTVTAPDGGNTSFFPPGGIIDTSNPPFPGEPATPTNLSQNLPSFFGTSSAAPNAAAVAAMMKELVPQATEAQIKAALIASTQPMNGTPKGSWNVQSGYGLINAPAALNAIDQLRVTSTTPANGATVSTAINSVVFNFNKAVNFSTVSASDLTFSTLPTGVSVTVGTPVEVSSTQISFPISFNFPVGDTANGSYAYTLSGPILATDGKSLVADSGTFTLADTVEPVINSTSFSGRTVQIQFSSAMRADTLIPDKIVNGQLVPGTVELAVQPSAGGPVQMIPPTNFSYNPTTFTVTLDFSGVPQSEMPTGTYYLAVQKYVTDTIGNGLNGQFSGVFPSGVANPTGPSTFVQSQFFTVQAPLITYFSLTPSSYSPLGISGNQNLNNPTPSFIGQLTSSFPAAVGGLTIYAEFNAYHGGVLNLLPGTNGRGLTGNYDITATTDSTGKFTFQAPSALVDGLNTMTVLAQGAQDIAGQPGLSSFVQSSFRIDTTDPTITGSSVTNGVNLNNLNSISLFVTDPVAPSSNSSPFAVPPTLNFPALNPNSADNTSNYTLTNTTTGVNYTGFITAANFTSTTVRTQPNQPYTGTVVLSIATGLPAGTYTLTAHTTESTYPGLVDAAGNPLASDFNVSFNIQSSPAYIETMTAVSTLPDGTTATMGLARAYFEQLPAAGAPLRDNVPAPPNQIDIVTSNPLLTDAQRQADGLNPYAQAIQIIRSANSSTSPSDGNFSQGSTPLLGFTVTLQDSIPGATQGQPGYDNELVINFPQGFVWPSDHFRIEMPNTGANEIIDQYGNQLDGEFLGNLTGPNQVVQIGSAPEPGSYYEDLLPNGTNRQNDMTGNGIAGGAFVAGFQVVPQGNVIYARPDYNYNPFGGPDYPNGSVAQPYPTLNPEAVANSINGGNLNSPINYTNFDPSLDYNGKGYFQPSAFYAAQVAAANGPVVIVALPGIVQQNPITGVVSQATFVSQAPIGSDGSLSVPFNTALVMAPGSTLKMQNASLLIQNQGSSLETLGGPGPNQAVNFTSWADYSIGNSGNPSDSTPLSGDWGGILFRNFDQAQFPTATFPVDGTLIGPPNPNAPGTNLPAISGADSTLSMINFATINYGGGAVPATVGYRYDAITLYSSRPAITNDTIANAGNPNENAALATAQAAISADVDSLLWDSIAQGPLIRGLTMYDNGINAIWIRPEFNGVAEATNSMPYQPTAPDGVLNYVLNSPYPYILTTELYIGQQYQYGGNTASTNNRLYINPGMMMKFLRGTGITVFPTGSINIGDRTYMNEYDQNQSFGPTTPGFKAPNTNVATTMFTSIYDNTASTTYTDPTTGAVTTIVAPNDVLNSGGANQPTPTNVPALARWGAIAIISGARAVITGATFQYGGGEVNYPNNTVPSMNVLNFELQGGVGTYAYIANNNFYYNIDAPMAVQPDGLPATNPLTPLNSGNPFIHGNVLVGNGINGLAVLTGGTLPNGGSNLNVNSIWDLTDITYVLRGTIVLGPSGSSFPGFIPTPLPNANQFEDVPPPSVSLTIQSQLGGTLLADGSTIPYPGQSVIVKLLNGTAPPATGTGGTTSSENGGAGFLVGVDNGLVPPVAPFFGPGVWSQLRILGIPGNETTHQPRVPAIITSIYDNSVGTTVRGVTMDQVITGSTQAPAAGDGGLIVFGGNSEPNFNVYDPRQGSMIDNAQISYITGIQVQGGGLSDIANVINATGSVTYNEGTSLQEFGINPLTGQVVPLLQNNTPQMIPITNSNLNDFSDTGVTTYPGPGLLARDVGTLGGYGAFNFGTPPNYFFSSLEGKPAYVYMSNDTISNMPIGAMLNGPTLTNNITNQLSPFYAVFLNDTFYNDNVGIEVQAQTYVASPSNDQAFVDFLAMDNIFSNDSQYSILTNGMLGGGGSNSQGQYNLFYQDGTDGVGVSINNPGSDQGGWGGNNNPVLGNPEFVDASAGNFALQGNSAAIDSARSEFGPDLTGMQLFPIYDQFLGTNDTVGVRNTTGRLGDFANPTPQDLVTLPGYPSRTFVDQFVPVLPGTPGAYNGTATIPGTDTYWYMPIGGERDILGNLRQKDPNSTNIGFGSRPFFDIGAYEYRTFNPPEVTGVTALVPSSIPGGQPIVTNIYNVGGIGGTLVDPLSISFQFNKQLDPSTINGLSVLLEESGNDGIFGNNNSPLDRFINLQGKLVYNNTTDTVTINLANQGLVLPDDMYRIILEGTGANPIRDPQGNALDGSNLDANGNQLPLPSGTGFPGSNFQVTFTIGQPAINGQFVMAASTDSNVRDGITNNVLPIFTGQVVDPFLENKPVAGQNVVVDVSTAGNGVFNLLNVGSGVTNANGDFSIQVSTPLPNSPYKVGPDGTLDALYSVDSNGNVIPNPNNQDTGYSIARVRVVDASGNTLSDPTAPNAQTPFIIDTNAPVVTAASPAPNSVATLDQNGQVDVSVTFNKTIYLPSITSSSVTLVGSGGTGTFGNSSNVTYPVNLANLGVTVNHTPLGGMTITFTLPANLPNDLYQLTLKGTGSAPIIDIAGNPLDGTFNGTFPSGNGSPGSDFVLQFAVFNPANVHIEYVGPASFITNATAAEGTRENPFPTITAGIQAAKIGDIVAVLPGVYTDPNNPTIMLKSLVRVLSASPSSTDSTWIPGSAIQTIIRSPQVAQGTTAIAVAAVNLISIPEAPTEISGFTITSSLVGNPATGPINTASIGMYVSNSDVLIDKNYFIVNNSGIDVTTSGGDAGTPTIETNVIAGNNYGIYLNPAANTSSLQQPIDVFNNDLVFNTNFGLVLYATASTPGMAVLANNIIWENHDLTSARNGFGIGATIPNLMYVTANLFQGNGQSDTLPYWAGYNIGGGFDPAILGPNPDPLGNITGNPAFVSPVDPRPGASGPALFLFPGETSFDLTLPSVAINNAYGPVAPAVDFEYRSPVQIPGRGRPGFGPASIGAFYYQPSSTSFGVTTTSLAPGGEMFAAGMNENSPNSIVVHFSQPVQQSSVTPTDLILSGPGVTSSTNPPTVSSLSWINSDTVQFNLSGQFAPSGGTVNVAIPSGSIVSSTNLPISGFQDSIQLAPAPVAVSTTPAGSGTGSGSQPQPVMSFTPPPAASPGAVSGSPVRHPGFNRFRGHYAGHTVATYHPTASRSAFAAYERALKARSQQKRKG